MAGVGDVWTDEVMQILNGGSGAVRGRRRRETHSFTDKTCQ